MRIALLAIVGSLVIVTGCASEPSRCPPAADTRAVPAPPTPAPRLDLDAIERKLEADAAARAKIEARIRVAVQGAADPQEAHRRMEEAIYAACDEEYGAQYRTEAIRQADAMVANGEVEAPRTVGEGIDLMRQVYAAVAARPVLARPYSPPAGGFPDEDLLSMQLWYQQSQMQALSDQMTELQRTIRSRNTRDVPTPTLPLSVYEPDPLLEMDVRQHIWEQETEQIRRHNQDVVRQFQEGQEQLRRQRENMLDGYGRR